MKISKKNRELALYLAASNWCDPVGSKIAIELQKRDDKIKALRREVKAFEDSLRARLEAPKKRKITTHQPERILPSGVGWNFGKYTPVWGGDDE